MKKYIHYKIVDFRIESLIQTITALDNSIKFLKNKITKLDYYDGGWFLEESEPIYGLAFIALQNYINSSIFDLDENLGSKIQHYQSDEKVLNSNQSRIQLIISIANYFKHRDDDSPLHRGTSQVLDDLNLTYSDSIEIENLPIFKGLQLLSKNYNLMDLVKITKNWREKIWNEKEWDNHS